MPRVLVCYKWVMDEQDIKINTGDYTLDTSRAKYKISDYDKNAVEEAVQLVENGGGSAEALTFGSTTVKQSLKDLLSRGPEKAYYLCDLLAEQADAFVTTNVLAAGIRKLGAYDLIICGEGSADSYNQQVAPRLATLLDIPAVTYVEKLAVKGNKVTATRKLGDSTEVITVEGPAVISVLPEINKPRIPSLKQVLAAGKKPSEEIKLADLGLAADELAPKVVSLTVKGYATNRKNVVFKEADTAANVAQLVNSLVKEGLC